MEDDDLSVMGGGGPAFGATQNNILCCMCGTLIAPNSANMCIDCLRSQVDITEGIPKQMTVQWCRGCGRYHQPPTAWIDAPLESPRLLTLCLKKLRGLSKVKLVDAGFVWTEPHSRRLKVKLTIQREVFAATILQQSFVVEYVVSGLQCGDCQKLQAQNTWTAVCQVRQKVNHKRTLFLLEQLILKHNAHVHTINIKEFPDGLDFYFHNRSHAIKFVEFLQGIVPIRYVAAQKLISHDVKSNIWNYKYTYSVEIAPICRDDLLCLPRGLARQLGNIHPLLLCHKVANNIRFLDPASLQGAEITPTGYWENQFRAIASREQLVEFVVLDISAHPSRKTAGRMRLCDVEVARARDYGHNDVTFLGRTHLGNILHPGDSVLGYDLTTAVFNEADLKALGYDGALPDFVLVKKYYQMRRRKASRSRHWELRSLKKEKVPLDSMSTRQQRELEAREVDQYEQFLQELEEDPELRARLNLYKAKNADKVARARADAVAEDADDFPEVQLCELMGDMDLSSESHPSDTFSFSDPEQEADPMGPASSSSSSSTTSSASHFHGGLSDD